MWPYDLGMVRNLGQVLTWSLWPVGNGVEWEVVEGADQYSLTREQMVQKAEKRERARKYVITQYCSGAWISLSHGISVCCNMPWSMESRIELEVGDTVMVTRWREHWLYGEKIQDEQGEEVSYMKKLLIIYRVRLEPN